jgi:hypothetical protein
MTPEKNKLGLAMVTALVVGNRVGSGNLPPSRLARSLRRDQHRGMARLGRGSDAPRARLSATTISILGFAYSLWAIAGAGEQTVYLGFLLLMAGVPVYAWIKYGRTKSRHHEA